jgi:hypothetical protein
MNDHLLHEMAKIRIEELREDAARAHAAKRAVGRTGWGFGLLGGLSRRAESEEIVAQGATAKEVCCA